MRSHFAPLFGLAVQHSFYGGTCGDVGFIAPRDTRGTMRRLGLLARSEPGTIAIWADTEQPRELDDELLRFGLKVLSPSVMNITDLASLERDELLVFRGDAMSSPVVRRFAGPSLPYAVATSVRPVEIRLSAPTGGVRNLSLGEKDVRTEVWFELRDSAPGEYELSERGGDGGPRRTFFYYDPELQAEGVLGVVEIRLASAFLEAPAAFEIQFEAPQQRLRYYVVTRGYSAQDVAKLSVVLGGDGNEEALLRVSGEGLETAEALRALEAPRGGNLLVFQSAGPIPRRLKPGWTARLRYNGSVLLDGLPQPARGSSRSEVIVHIAKST